jgi:hypothetical protein
LGDVHPVLFISIRLEKLNQVRYPVLASKIEGCPVPQSGTGRYTCKSKFNCNAPVAEIAPHSLKGVPRKPSPALQMQKTNSMAPA